MINNQKKDYKMPYSPAPAQEEAPQQRSYLADLFVIPEDPAEYAEWRAELFGQKKPPPNGSFTID